MSFWQVGWLIVGGLLWVIYLNLVVEPIWTVQQRPVAAFAAASFAVLFLLSVLTLLPSAA